MSYKDAYHPRVKADLKKLDKQKCKTPCAICEQASGSPHTRIYLLKKF